MAKRIDESLAVLEEIKKKTDDQVSNFRIKSDVAEEARRRLEEERRLRRYDSIELDAIQCNRKQAKIELNWQDIMQINVPQDLHAALEQQKAECNSVISKKDRKLIEFSADLREKDDEFVKSVNENNKDVKGLIDSMHQQYQTMRKSYKEQLQEIEAHLIKEREEMLDAQKKKLDELFKTRKNKEEYEYYEARKARMEQFRVGLEVSRAKDQDSFSRVKLQHELAIQDLEQHWARMNATYHLNREKLDYNSQILAERHKEFHSIISAYRQRIQRLRSSLSRTMAEHREQEKTLKQINDKVTGEYKRLTRQVKELQKKLLDFSSVAERQFREAWLMHSSEVEKIAHKVYEADKVICEQQLCLQWEPPNVRLERERFERANDGDSMFAGSALGRSGKGGARGSVRGSDRDSKANASSAKGNNGAKVKAEDVRYLRVMELILQEASFLLDISVREQADQAETPEEAFRIKKAAMESYLGFPAIDEDDDDGTDEAAEDKEMLVATFAEGADEEDEDVLCEPDECLDKLKAFIAAKNERRLQNVAPTATRKKKRQSANANSSSASDEAAKREMERRWWQERSRLLPEVTLRVWKALDKALLKYHALLEERANTLEANMRLKKQNDELMVLLDQYIHSRVNEELKVPPKHVIKVV